MEEKKNKKADVDRQAGLTGNFFLIGLVISVSMVIVAFQYSNMATEKKTGEPNINIPDDRQIAEVTKQKKKKPQPKAPPEIKVVPDEVEVKADRPKVQSAEMLDDTKIQLPSGTNEKTVEEPRKFVPVEDQPGFPGGKNAFHRYMSEHMRYPSSAKEAGIEGVVVVSFVVNKDGSITNVTVKEGQGLTKALNKEAIRVVKNMPKWKPGKQRGRPVRVQHAMPIRFSLN